MTRPLPEKSRTAARSTEPSPGSDSEHNDASNPPKQRSRLFGPETRPGMLLLLATVLALFWANSPLAELYTSVRDFSLPLPWLHELHLDLSLGQFSSDGLLAIFFFLAGLELKLELRRGELRDPRRAVLPVLAAVGGVVLPALIFLALTAGDPELARGWAIPTATDIAFALGILAIAAPRLPAAVRTFLLTLAVVDDLIAITIIAIFYGDDLQWAPLAGALIAVVLFAVALRWREGLLARWWILLPLAVLAWAGIHAAGIHATVAGVLLAFTVPIPSMGTPRLARRLDARLSPISTYLAVPAFAFFAAGVSLGSNPSESLRDPVALAVMTALVVGKCVGVLGTSWLLTRLPGFALGKDVSWPDMFGVALLTGVGFTVSLLVTELAYGTTAEHTAHAKIAVLLGSATAGVLGAVVLHWRQRVHDRDSARS